MGYSFLPPLSCKVISKGRDKPVQEELLLPRVRKKKSTVDLSPWTPSHLYLPSSLMCAPSSFYCERKLSSFTKLDEQQHTFAWRGRPGRRRDTCVMVKWNNVVSFQQHHTTLKSQQREVQTIGMKIFSSLLQRLIQQNVQMLIVFQCPYLDFSFILWGIQQCHLEGGGFKTLWAFLRRFQVLVWGGLLRCVLGLSVFVLVLGVLFLWNIKSGIGDGKTSKVKSGNEQNQKWDIFLNAQHASWNSENTFA